MTALLLRSCGPATSIQDRGRFGWQRYGIASSGAADPLALAAANALVGNPLDTAALELMLLGATLETVDAPARLALAGAAMPLTIDGVPQADHTSFVLAPGRRLTIGPARTGVCAVLAVEGGFDLVPALGSHSLHARAGLGGLSGRTLRGGDTLPLLKAAPTARGEAALPPLPVALDRPLEVVLGPQDDHFTPQGIATFLGSPYIVTAEADRMGYRLAGPHIAHAGDFNIVSDGIVAGSVQVPGSGQPIVLLADRQTTGGYPKIATVASADLRLLAQRRPGDAVRFAAVTVESAQASARAATAERHALPERLRPVRRGAPDSAALLTMNVAGAALDAHDPATWYS